MWIALLLKPLALVAAVAGLAVIRRTVERRMPDSRLKRFLLWPGEVRRESGADESAGGRPGA